MNIEKYATYFHDGTIYELLIVNKNISITMESACLKEEENEDEQPLSRFGSIRGTLYLNEIFDLKINNEQANINELIYNFGDILHLRFKENQILLTVIWFSEDGSDIYQELKFLVRDYFFENIPSLIFPGDEDFDDEGRYIGPKIGA